MTKDERRWFICYFGEQFVFWFRRFELTKDKQHFARAERFAEQPQKYLPSCLKGIPCEDIVELIEGMLAGMPKRED